MDNFAMTKGGHEFLYGTMPRLARNIEENTKAIECLTEVLNGTFLKPDDTRLELISEKTGEKLSSLRDELAIEPNAEARSYIQGKIYAYNNVLSLINQYMEVKNND